MLILNKKAAPKDGQQPDGYRPAKLNGDPLASAPKAARYLPMRDDLVDRVAFITPLAASRVPAVLWPSNVLENSVDALVKFTLRARRVTSYSLGNFAGVPVTHAFAPFGCLAFI
jgi:hypothetical protein